MIQKTVLLLNGQVEVFSLPTGVLAELLAEVDNKYLDEQSQLSREITIETGKTCSD